MPTDEMAKQAGKSTVFPSTLYLFKTGRRGRSLHGSFPTEFFYGAHELGERGLPVTWTEEAELMAAIPGPVRRLLALMLRPLPRLLRSFPVPLWTALFYAQGPVRRALDRYQVVVATTQTQGMCLGLLKRLGLLQCQVAFIVMGALPGGISPFHRRLLRWCLGGSHPLSISQGERQALAAEISGPVRYVPFGVHVPFWSQGSAADAGEDYVLSIGNDRNRDFRTLVDAWEPHFPPLRIVTSLPVRTDKANVQVVKGDWRSQLLSDEAIRDLFTAARFVVIPLRQTIQPAGQSACLQAMACGKAVILSEIDGLWDRAALRHGETCLLVPPGSVGGMAAAAARLVAEPELCRSLGGAAREAVSGRLNTTVMADGMAEALQEIAG